MSKRMSTLFITLILLVCCKTESPIDRINEIKTLPFKGEQVDDEVYNQIRNMGDSALPLLIDKISDTTRMRDPRQSPIYENIRVGDIAYFIFIEISNKNFDFIFSEDLKIDYKKEGVYAYFRFVQNYQNRIKLKKKLREWYNSNY